MFLKGAVLFRGLVLAREPLSGEISACRGGFANNNDNYKMITTNRDQQEIVRNGISKINFIRFGILT